MSESQELGASDPGSPTATTGVAAVDAVLDSLTGLDGLPLEEHVAVYESAHERLRRALDTRPQLPPRPGQPAGS